MVFKNPRERIVRLVASAARWQPSSSFGTLGEFLASDSHRLLHDGIPISPQTTLRRANMKSEFFKDFGLPDADCEIEAAFHPQFRIPYLFFRSTGNPLVGLDMTGASQLQQRLAHAGEMAKAKKIEDHIANARRL
jgi:hypothetical protein